MRVLATIADYKTLMAQVDEAARQHEHEVHQAEVRERFRALGTTPPSEQAGDLRSDIAEAKERMRETSINAEPVWHNVWGEEVDLDNIDREYALNILMMAHARRVRMGYTRDDFMRDELIQKLRDIVLEGRKKTLRDRLRGARYNMRCRRKGLPYRA